MSGSASTARRWTLSVRSRRRWSAASCASRNDAGPDELRPEVTSRRAAAWVLLFAALVIVATRLIDTGSGRSGDAGGGGVSAATDLRPRDALVLRVVDGDTILVRLAAGGTERVRYIGVD